MNLDDLIVNGDSECLILRVMDFQRKSQAQAQASGFMAETEKDEEKKEKVIGWPTVCRCLEFLRANKADVGVATAEEAERVILNGFPRIYSDNAAAAASDGGPERQAASFYRVVREWLSAREWAISDVRGDGNCFFRSLVRALFRAAIPSVSASGSDDVEGSLAQYLREETDKMKIYQDYVAADEGDQRVMGQPGVWADAVQVAKASQYLEVPIHVVRCDDPGLRFNSDSGEITPSPLYQYGNNFDEPPFVLLYDPFPVNK